jgi:type VI secretion system secreted protein Hcp
MARVDMFLKLDGIDGESRDQDHKNEIDIFAYSWEVSNSGSAGPARKTATRVKDVAVAMTANKASVAIAQACATARNIPTAVITVRKAGDKPLEFLVIKLTDVYVTRFAWTGQQKDGLPEEAVELSFAKIEQTYKPQNPDGSAGAAVTKSYDVTTNRG